MMGFTRSSCWQRRTVHRHFPPEPRSSTATTTTSPPSYHRATTPPSDRVDSRRVPRGTAGADLRQQRTSDDRPPLDTLRRPRRLIITHFELHEASWFDGRQRQQRLAEEFGPPQRPASERPTHPAGHRHLLQRHHAGLDRRAADADIGLAALTDNADTVLTAVTNGADIPAAPQPDNHPAEHA